jgi:hypothetical protein
MRKSLRRDIGSASRIDVASGYVVSSWTATSCSGLLTASNPTRIRPRSLRPSARAELFLLCDRARKREALENAQVDPVTMEGWDGLIDTFTRPCTCLRGGRESGRSIPA